MSQVITQENTATDIQVISTPAQLLQLAVTQGADIDKLEKLMDLQERWQRTEAKKDFYHALSLFKSESVSVDKDKNVSFKTQKGQTNYNHASLSHICDVISPLLGKYGLSYNWSTNQSDAGLVSVTCTLSHSSGHSESTTLSSGIDSSGGKNNIQALGSAVSYLQRYTLKAITGTAEADQDDDGAGADQIKIISEEQVTIIYSAIKDNDINMQRFMAWLKRAAKCESIESVPTTSFVAVTNQIKQIAGKANEG